MEKELLKMEEEGFTTRFAVHYLHTKEEEKKNTHFSKELIERAHNNGFYADNYFKYTDNEKNSINNKAYLSDYDYEKLWPLNDWMRIWVNDKLTLKYMLSGTHFNSIMPKYYYYMSNQGLRSLIDNNDDEQTAKSFIKKLKEVGCFACKPCNGTESVGFFKLSYNNGSFFINEKEVSEKEIESTILQRKNYIYTEYLEAGGNLGLIFPKIHTIRMMILNTDGAHPFLMPVCYIRFGSNSTGEANYVRNGDKLDEDFTIFADVNVENGSFSNAKAFYLNRMIEIKKHPDSSMELEGIIPNWDRLRETALGVSKLLFGVEWIGLDMCIDKDCNPRLMEINTQPGIGYLQVYHPLMAIPEVNEYITEKLKRIEEMDSLRKKERNRIAR